MPKKPRIIYIANARIPTERANGVQIVNTCAALAAAGADVTLVVPRRFNALKADPYEYYSVPRNFTIRRLPAVDTTELGKIGFWLQEWSFALSARIYLFLNRAANKDAVIYVRGERVFSGLLSQARKHSLFLESHMKPKDMEKYGPIFRKARGVVVVTKYYKEELEQLNIPAFYSPDGVTVSDFDIGISKEEARKKTGLPPDKAIVMYTGHLYSWKGADVLALAAAPFQE
jgi:glycosyltransferase involved in cell wall biosynthesis